MNLPPERLLSIRALTEHCGHGVCWWCLGSAVLWFCFWSSGLPAPHVDDLFFVGAGVSIAQGGGLHNPWIEPWLRQFGGSDYFAQLPVHPYVLALWLKCCGASTASLLALQCMIGWSLCTLCALIVRRLVHSEFAAAATWVVAATFVLQHGLRPEAWGATLALVAAWLWWGSTPRQWALGSVAATLGVLVHPFAAAVIIPVAIASLLWQWKTHGKSETMRSIAVQVSCGLLGAFGVAVLVDFRMSEFWHAFHTHAKMRTPAPGGELASFWENMTVGREAWLKGPIVLALLASAACAWRSGHGGPTLAGLGLAAGVMACGIFIYASQAPKWLLPVCGGIALSLWARVTPRSSRAAGVAGTAIAMGWSVFPSLLQIPGPRQARAEEYAGLRSTIERLRPTTLLVDETAARYIYDYALPPGARDWLLTRHCDVGMSSLLAGKPPGETWLVDERKLGLYVPDSGVNVKPRTVLAIPYGRWAAEQAAIRLVP